jgi:subtilisin family serine protease
MKKITIFLCFLLVIPTVIAFDTDRQPKMTRVIADTVSKENIKTLIENGCVLRHRLRERTSLECPEDKIEQLGVREARIFHILDLQADQQIGADKVWIEGITGSGVKVAVLDTGIDTDHPELQDSYLGGYDYVFNDNVPEDDHGHGTHVSGIITSNGVSDANSKGVSPSAGIYMYKVCDSAGNCYEDDMMAAMEAAVLTDAKVMSISIGGGSYTTENCDSDTLAAKVNWVVSQGLTVVVAAGNDGKGVSSPGCASGAIAIGAVDSSNNVVYFSGRGPALDIVAPGYNIYSTVIGGYGRMSGTSMATPHVSGVVALLVNTNPSLTTSDIKTALYNTAKPVNKCYKCTRWVGSTCFSQAETPCTRDITGAGVVDAYGAYLYVKQPTTTTVPTTTTTIPNTTTTTIITTTTTVPTTTTTIITTTTTTTTIPLTKCWSGSYQYLDRNANQARKFCKCAQGTYGYKSYSSYSKRATVYYYLDSGNNMNWNVGSKSAYFPIYRVVCTNGQAYATNVDYYR